MPASRWIALSAATVLLFGSLAVTGGYAWYLRSDAYRSSCCARLSEALRLPSELGLVVPRSRTSREFQDVTVWLPSRRGIALTCRRAIVANTPTNVDPDAYEVQLSGGSCEISTRTWLRSDYREVVESGLRPGFDTRGPRRVTFRDMDLHFERDEFSAHFTGAAGRIEFDEGKRGVARITCREFNRRALPEPVVVLVEFSRGNGGVRIDSLDLQLPAIPLEQAAIDRLIGLTLTRGRFAGGLRYRETDEGPALLVSGSCMDLDLAECTANLAPGPWRGRFPELELIALQIERGRPTRLRFRGLLKDLELSDVLASWGVSGGQGKLSLEIGEADLTPDGIARFAAGGQGESISLAGLTAALGWGTMTGDLLLKIDNLTLRDNRLIRAEGSAIVADAVESPNWIEGRLLHELAKRALSIELPSFLPERLEYTRLGASVEVRDEELFVFGSHGERNRTILTASIFGQEFPLAFEPRHSFVLTPVLDPLRARLLGALERWREPPASQPAAGASGD